MPRQTIINFQQCSAAVEEMRDPGTGEVTIRVMVIMDPEDGCVYRLPMHAEEAKILGQKLMGIGQISVVNGGASPSVADITRHGRKR